VAFWNPPIELSVGEKFIAKRCEKRRVFVFLREYDPGARTKALRRLLNQVQSLGTWLEKELAEELATPPLARTMHKCCPRARPQHFATRQRRLPDSAAPRGSHSRRASQTPTQNHRRAQPGNSTQPTRRASPLSRSAQQPLRPPSPRRSDKPERYRSVENAA